MVRRLGNRSGRLSRRSPGASVCGAGVARAAHVAATSAAPGAARGTWDLGRQTREKIVAKKCEQVLVMALWEAAAGGTYHDDRFVSQDACGAAVFDSSTGKFVGGEEAAGAPSPAAKFAGGESRERVGARSALRRAVRNSPRCLRRAP